MKSSIIAVIFVGFAVAFENGNRSLDSGLQPGKIKNKKKRIFLESIVKIEMKTNYFILTTLGPFIQTWRSLLYKLYSDVPPEYYSHVQQLIDSSYSLERTLGTGNIDGIMDEYGKSIDIAKNLMPHVKDTKLQSILSDRIKDFEELVNRLKSGEKNGHTIQGLLDRISDNVATTVNHVVGAVHNVVKGIIDGIFNLIGFGRHT